jgi:hypothetical protein
LGKNSRDFWVAFKNQGLFAASSYIHFVVAVVVIVVVVLLLFGGLLLMVFEVPINCLFLSARVLRKCSRLMIGSLFSLVLMDSL